MAGFPNSQSNPNSAIPVYNIEGAGSGGPVPIPPGTEILYYEQITDLSGVTTLDPPDGATLVAIQVNGGIVRYLFDGNVVSGTFGMLAYATGPILTFSAPFTNLQFIQNNASTGSLNVLWYGAANA